MDDGVSRLLSSSKTEDRIRAVQRLAASGSADDLKLLLAALRDRSSYVAGLAAAALEDQAPWEFCHDLLAAFDYAMAAGPKRDPGCSVRTHLAIALGRHAYAFAADAMRAGVACVQVEYIGGMPVDTAPPLRAACAQVLAEIRHPDALRDIGLLLFELTDSPMETAAARVGAARALARLADAAGATLLAIKLRNPAGEVPEVITECMQALIQLEDERAHEALIPYLSAEELPMAAFAAMTLARTRRVEAALAIADCVDRFRGELQETVVLALARCGVPEARDAVERLAAIGRPGAKRSARLTMEAMGWIAPE